MFPEEPQHGDPPPPPPDVAQNDLMMRLGLLLGNRAPSTPVIPSSAAVPSVVQTGNQTEETFTSVSSLTSSENAVDKTHSDTSPLSSLTGKWIINMFKSWKVIENHCGVCYISSNVMQSGNQAQCWPLRPEVWGSNTSPGRFSLLFTLC